MIEALRLKYCHDILRDLDVGTLTYPPHKIPFQSCHQSHPNPSGAPMSSCYPEVSTEINLCEWQLFPPEHEHLTKAR